MIELAIQNAATGSTKRRKLSMISVASISFEKSIWQIVSAKWSNKGMFPWQRHEFLFYETPMASLCHVFIDWSLNNHHLYTGCPKKEERSIFVVLIWYS